MDDPPKYLLNNFIFIKANLPAEDYTLLLAGLVSICLLIIASGIMSASENAFFSLTRKQLEEILEQYKKVSNAVSYLLRFPKKLLATILIANTMINVAIVMVTTLIFNLVFDFVDKPILGFLLETILVTFILVLFGEVIPKIYAVQNNKIIVRLMAIPMYSIYKMLMPLVLILEKTSSIIDKRITSKGHILTVDELTHAIDITSEKDAPKQEKKLLKSIVNFGNISVNQIMRQRPDIAAIEINASFNAVLKQINDTGYSRLPVYDGNLDQIKGILFTKDLLPYLNENDNFNWQSLLRKPFFVPESKKIDDLLKDFQKNRVHLAIVVDEFGGTSGLISMEDILEEIFGEINDEFDEDEHIFTKINDNTFVFEAKILINDVCKYMELDTNVFDEARKEADTLGGMILELNGDLPEEGKEINFGDFTFKVEAVDKRRIKRIKVTRKK
jgi:gliding motility-associated protein GldE